MGEPTIETWILAGELRQAAAWLVHLYGADVLATCVAMVGDRVAAEDVAQDAFSDAFRGLAGFRGDSSPRTWLLSIVRNRCIDYLRARKRDPWVPPGGGTTPADDGDRDRDDDRDPDAHPDQTAASADWFADRALLLRALDALAEGDRALVTLRFRNGLEYDELATAFGLKEGTVRMRMSRALARMREVIGPEAGGGKVIQFPAAAAPPAPHAPEAPSRPRLPHAEAEIPTPPKRPTMGVPPLETRLFGASRRVGGVLTGRQPPAVTSPLGRALAECIPGAMTAGFAARLDALVNSLAGGRP